MTAWLAALVLCVLSGRAPEAGAQSGALPAPAANTLVRVSTSPGPDYTRLAFTFENPLDYYVVRREDVDRLLVDFGQARLAGRPTAAPDELIDGVEFNFEDGRLTARIFLKAMRYELRHFLSRDKYSCILDLKNLESPGLETPPPPDDLKPLTLPTLAEEARLVGLLAPPGSEDGPPERLFQRILNELTDWNNQAALEDLLRFRELFPGHPLLEPALFLLGDAYFVTGPLSETYTAAVEAWTEALNRWPQSYLAGRAQFMLAEADQAMGYQNEAAAKYKLLAAAAVSGDDPYAKLALLRAADLQLNMGLIDEARKTLEPVLEQGLADRLGLEAYARLGMADFYEGLYSQANEIFREALREAPQLYTGYPEMLYAMGEAYHYLDRPDLSRMFLMHALSLMPDHPKADVIMARIGDSYRKEGRDDEAMAIYGAAKRRFPDGDGGLISQVRLADMGALHSFFTQDKVFDSLERGARQATVEMYQGIVDTASSSPLLQLAYLKIGLALAEDGETSEAIKWLRDLDMKYPKSALLPEALPALSRALVNETTLRAELEEWEAVADLYADNSSYLTDADRPVAQRIVARAYEKLGRFDEAREVWKALEEQTPEKRLARAQGLVVSSLKMERPMEALDYLLTMAEEFPEQAAWLDLQADQIGLALARPQNASATADLLKFRTMIPTEAVRRRALADAVEIEINGRRYDKATALMDEYRREYPDDELTPEYLLTQAKIEERQKRYENGWDMLSDFRRLYPDDPRGPELLLEQIRKADALGREDDAFRFMALYQMRYPERAESRELLTEKMRREWDLGRYADSQSTFEAFRRAYPGDPAIPALLMDRAARDWEKGRYDESQWAVDEMLLNYPDDPRTPTLLLERAARDWEAERYEASQAAVDRLTQLYHDDPRVPETLLRRAENDWGRERLEAARRDWGDFRRAYPDDPRLGRSFLDQYKKSVEKGLTEEAFALAEGFRASRPDDPIQPDLMLEEAKDLFTIGRSTDGLAMWERFRGAFPDDPRTPELMLIQARQELKGGLNDAALAHYQEFIGQYPGHAAAPDVYLEAAAAETRLGRLEQAWDRLARYSQLFPGHEGRPRALLDQVELGRQLGRNLEAAELYKTFRRDYPRSPQVPAAYLDQARLEIAGGRNLQAVETLEEGLLTTPQLDEDPQAQALLADLYLEVGRVEDWAAIVERNLNRDSNAAARSADRFLKYQQLAQVHQELGQAADAERNYDSALSNRPPDASPEALYAIAGAYKKLMRPDKYADALALVRDSGDPFWRKVAEDELAALPPAAPQS